MGKTAFKPTSKARKARVVWNFPVFVVKSRNEEEEEAEETKEGPAKVEPLKCVIDLEYCVGWQYVEVEESYRQAGMAWQLLEDVMRQTVTEDGKERKVFVYAHNMTGFDSSFILTELYKMGYKIVKVLSKGAKFLSFECNNMVFRDSLDFFNMALENLPATFDLQEMHKGLFAYSWIKPEKYDYVGDYPPVEDYHPERMSEKRRKEFLAWHKQKIESVAVFDFQKELSAYLRSDEEVLNGSLEAFSEEMVELTGIDPVTQCVTIASTAFLVWQKMFLERDLIALEPQNGWRQNQTNQSREAIEWLEFENSKIGGGIQVSCVKSMHLRKLCCSALPQLRFSEMVWTVHC